MPPAPTPSFFLSGIVEVRTNRSRSAIEGGGGNGGGRVSQWGDGRGGVEFIIASIERERKQKKSVEKVEERENVSH